MIKLVSNLSIKRKLLLALILSSVLSLLFTGMFLMVLEITEFQKNTRDDLSTLATIIGNRSTAALAFNDLDLAKENLGVLNTLPEVQAACLYDAQGTVFAQLSKNSQEESSCPQAIGDAKTRFESVNLYIVQPILIDAEKLGSVYIRADLTQLVWRKIQFIGLLFAVFLAVTTMTLSLIHISEPTRPY